MPFSHTIILRQKVLTSTTLCICIKATKLAALLLGGLGENTHCASLWSTCELCCSTIPLKIMIASEASLVAKSYVACIDMWLCFSCSKSISRTQSRCAVNFQGGECPAYELWGVGAGLMIYFKVFERLQQKQETKQCRGWNRASFSNIIHKRKQRSLFTNTTHKRKQRACAKPQAMYSTCVRYIVYSKKGNWVNWCLMLWWFSCQIAWISSFGLAPITIARQTALEGPNSTASGPATFPSNNQDPSALLIILKPKSKPCSPLILMFVCVCCKFGQYQ